MDNRRKDFEDIIPWIVLFIIAVTIAYAIWIGYGRTIYPQYQPTEPPSPYVIVNVPSVVIQWPTETATATKSPRTPTSTPRPVFGPDVTMTPGVIYRVPRWTPTPYPAQLEPTLPPCDIVTSEPMDDQLCGV